MIRILSLTRDVSGSWLKVDIPSRLQLLQIIQFTVVIIVKTAFNVPVPLGHIVKHALLSCRGFILAFISITASRS